jgi:hypothetical protein
VDAGVGVGMEVDVTNEVGVPEEDVGNASVYDGECLNE